MNSYDLPSGASTPFLAVDVYRLEQNIERVHDRLTTLGLRMRPHIKTHKCAEIGRRQVAAGVTGLTVATIDEAEVVATYCDDIFIAYCLWPDEGQAERLAALSRRVRLTVGTDSTEAVRRLAELRLTDIELGVEIDVGHGRSGCTPAESGRLAQEAESLGLRVTRCFAFPGHGYAQGGGAAAAADEARVLGKAATEIARVTGKRIEVSGGSTPTVAAMTADPLTEAPPGVYVFNDAQQVELGTATFDDVALWCVARVVGRSEGKAVLDSGSKALGADRAAYSSGFGRLLDFPAATIVQLSEHHAVAELPDGCDLALGDLVRVVPNHVCNAVNLHDVLHPLVDGRWGQGWRVEPRSGVAR